MELRIIIRKMEQIESGKVPSEKTELILVGSPFVVRNLWLTIEQAVERDLKILEYEIE